LTTFLPTINMDQVMFYGKNISALLTGMLTYQLKTTKNNFK